MRISSADTETGSSSGNVTRSVVLRVLAPDAIAASSSEGSMLLKPADNSRNASGTLPTACTQIMPGRL